KVASWCVGGSLLFAIVLFQASNNHAIAMAFEGIDGDRSEKGTSSTLPILLVLVTNGFVISLLLAGKRHLYRLIERSMMILVGLMLVGFLATLCVIGLDWGPFLSGLIPSIPADAADSKHLDWMSAAALVATTFSVAGAFFQSYQVRQRGWTREDLSAARQDSIIGISTLAMMTIAIVMTAAGALYGRIDASDLDSAAAVASQLRPLFGNSAAMLFSLGILAGALSSFVVNALIGGAVGSDAFGWGSSFSSNSVRRMTIVSLLIGMVISIGVMASGVRLLSFIVVAQALTVLSFPLLAMTMILQWWSIRHSLDPRERWLVAIGLALGLFVVLGLSFRTVIGVLAG
ncbi:MAG: divalent metal cation transporter, partial [Planctomycetota bacterium]